MLRKLRDWVLDWWYGWRWTDAVITGGQPVGRETLWVQLRPTDADRSYGFIPRACDECTPRDCECCRRFEQVAYVNG